MEAVEQAHIVSAITFELGKCFETTIRERMLQVLANVDPDLCAGVAEGLGLEPPKPSEPPADVDPSAALSQLGARWPVTGRTVGIVVGADADVAQVAAARDAVLAAGMVPLVVAPKGGKLGQASAALDVQRTYLTARSVEFDAILVAGAVPPAPDAQVPLDAKAGGKGGKGAKGTALVDPRIALMPGEAFRHAKTIGAWGAGSEVLPAAGCPAGAPGVVIGTDAPEVWREPPN